MALPLLGAEKPCPMASLTPRLSGLWEDTPDEIMGLPDEDGRDSDSDDLEQQRLIPHAETHHRDDYRTPLDKTIDRIGMGTYQWMLVSLCGLGWLADNMWMQAIAIILPRVQQHYQVPDNHIGIVSSSVFAGMMCGALGWGTYSDLLGRSAAFNATLFFTSLFGLLSSFAYSYASLCVLLFFLGSAVGGSMPTDGTLLLEHMPRGKQYLVTALSVFFSFGSVLASLVALFVLPQHSCLRSASHCDVDIENQGWKYLLATLALITLSMFLARIVFFRLHESPRYLVHAGRPQEALFSLRMISRFNGSDLTINLDDVHDHRVSVAPMPTTAGDHHGLPCSPMGSEQVSTRTIGQHDDPPRLHDAVDAQELGLNSSSAPIQFGDAQAEFRDYHATRDASPMGEDRGESPLPLHLDIPNSGTAACDSPSNTHGYSPASSDVMATPASDMTRHDPLNSMPPSLPPPPASSSQPSRQRRSGHSLTRRSSILSEKHIGTINTLPRWIRRPLTAWLERVAMVLTPQWRRTTLLVCAAWFGLALAYTMFNVFLPKLLETESGEQKTLEAEKTLQDTLWDIVIYTIGGCPGAILGAYLVETRLRKRWSLAGSTFITALLCALFVRATSPWTVRLTIVGFSLSSTTMWAVLYGWTPEIFGTKVRGTACGMASALSRIGGMIAPLLGGALLITDRSVPVYTSVIVFSFAGFCVLLLNEQRATPALH